MNGFPGVQKTTWTHDDLAKAYDFHRFYSFQPDLNTHLPAVRQEIQRIMGFWLQLGGSGFRMDAVPFLIERKGAGVTPTKDYELLHEMRDFLQWRCRDAVLLAEANVPPAESLKYFGEHGDRLQLMLNFPVNQRLFYALATGDLRPLVKALEDTRTIPQAAQLVNFLRSHDELDLGRLTDAQRQRVFDAFGPEPSMQLYDRGIRRRLAQRRDQDSLLNWMGRAIRMRKECPEIGWGQWKRLGSDASDVLVMRYEFEGRAVLTAHNFGERPLAVTLSAREVGSDLLVDMLAEGQSKAEGGKHVLELAPSRYRWYRVGGMDRLATPLQSEPE